MPSFLGSPRGPCLEEASVPPGLARVQIEADPEDIHTSHIGIFQQSSEPIGRYILDQNAVGPPFLGDVTDLLTSRAICLVR